MDKCTKEQPRRGLQNSSFSSTLLDAVFRSIGAPRAGGGRQHPAPAPSARWGSAAAAGRPVCFYRASSSSSSDTTSFGGFSSSSSSEHGSAGGHRERARANRPLTPLRSASSPPPYHRNRIKASPIRIKARSPVLSRGARITGFLGSLLSMGTGKPKAASGDATDSMPAAANYSRPCLLKTTTSRRQAAEGEGLKRSVRFHLGANAVLGSEQGGQGGDRRITKEGKRKRREEMRKRLEEILRGLEEEEEEEMMSDASSDLFELENLTAAGGGVYMDDELPVYSSTHLSTNQAISAILRL